MSREVAIPHCYVWMTQGYTMRATMFKRYVRAYIKQNEPGWKLVDINGMTAICERVNQSGKRQKAETKAK